MHCIKSMFRVLGVYNFDPNINPTVLGTWCSDFLRNTQNLKKKNLSYDLDKSAALLSKRQNHEEDFFSNYVCFSKSPNCTVILTCSQRYTTIWLFSKLKLPVLSIWTLYYLITKPWVPQYKNTIHAILCDKILLCSQLLGWGHGLRTPREKISFTARPKI